ncbi:MAG: peptidoglycan DD-metalloendopeptidase family protein [Candidatus Zambryskibacteria bacterium]|nr:peptidoglycan DD-metalloendopeptidase family protein [Candidatus Zambryskibacteria bacterium]
MKYAFKHTISISLFLLLLFLNFSLFYKVLGQTTSTSTDDLISKIEERNNQIKQLEQEINQYNSEVDNASKQGVTLQNTLKTLDLTKKKITTDINLTDTKINKTVLTIEQLNNEIKKTKDSIDVDREAIINAIQDTRILEDMNIIQIILSNKNISDIWNEIDSIKEIQNVIRDRSKELAILKAEMETKQIALTGQKKSLVNLKQDLNGKKQAVLSTTQEKATLLAQTKNKEETFKQLVKTKEEQKAQFEKELYEYESQLNLTVDINKYPAPLNGILSWPLDSIFITQKFGKTVDAKKLYVSGSHNGVDFRASVGTRVKNVLDGVVVGTGNTDLYPGCYSFGKWLMVKHDNGLSTIYGHLSVISASVGQRLSTGDLIGYSGNTGYTTGPHLHISVYATQGVRIERYVNSIGCKQATLPLADIKAYLDPLAYFPN